MNPFQSVEDFMIACGQETREVDTISSVRLAQCDLYKELIKEEYQELLDADTLESELDAICDMIYVLVGLAKSRGYDIEGAFKEVQRSNMSKVDKATGKVIRREDGKILKPSTFSPPHLVPYV